MYLPLLRSFVRAADICPSRVRMLSVWQPSRSACVVCIMCICRGSALWSLCFYQETHRVVIANKPPSAPRNRGHSRDRKHHHTRIYVRCHQPHLYTECPRQLRARGASCRTINSGCCLVCTRPRAVVAGALYRVSLGLDGPARHNSLKRTFFCRGWSVEVSNLGLLIDTWYSILGARAHNTHGAHIITLAPLLCTAFALRTRKVVIPATPGGRR